jgi:hypothetical protein
MHSGALVSQFAVEDELSARSMMRRRQAWKKYESFRDRAAMPPIKNYTKVVMNKSDIDKLLASPDARREAWIEYMTQPAAVAAPSRVKSPPREGLSDKERAAIERKFSNILQQHGVASIMLRHNFIPLETRCPAGPLPGPAGELPLANIIIVCNDPVEPPTLSLFIVFFFILLLPI